MAGFIFTLILAGALFSYYLYQNGIEEKAQLKKQIEELKKTREDEVVPAGTEIPLLGPKADPLPVTDDSGDSAVPISVEKLEIDREKNKDGRGQNQNQNQDQDQEAAKSLDTGGWKTYINKKYKYSFRYPKEFDFSSCDKNNPCQYGQVYEKDGGDAAWLSGSTGDKDWPYIIISHYDNESFTLPKNTKFFDWLKQKFGWSKENVPKDFNFEIAAAKGDPKKAMRIGVPQTPQAYAREEIYFESGGKIFQIQLLDSNKAPAQEFYNAWLGTFVLN